MAYLATLALDRGRRAGLLATAGVAAGLSVHAVVAALGLGVLISEAPLLYDLLRWIGVAYLLYLAWETWRSGAKEPGVAAAASSSLFWRGFFSNVFNPKSILFFISVIPGFIQYDFERVGFAVSGRAAGGGICYDCDHDLCEHRAACESIEAVADRRGTQEGGSADTGTCAGAGRGVARLVDTPDLTGGLPSWRSPRRFDLRQNERPRMRYIKAEVIRFSGSQTWHAMSLGS